jgi:hypothetical protein
MKPDHLDPRVIALHRPPADLVARGTRQTLEELRAKPGMFRTAGTAARRLALGLGISAAMWAAVWAIVLILTEVMR